MVGAKTGLIKGTLCFLSQAGNGTTRKDTILFSREKVKLRKDSRFQGPHIFSS
jgi:hypothetical protein